jgi:hypothetical protein
MMSLDTLGGGGLKPRVPGLKGSTGRAWLGGSLLTGGLIPMPPITSRSTSDALGITKPDIPKVPGVPTIDQAKQYQQETDRIRRRRGVFANIFGGSSGSAASVGTRALLGS